MLAQAAVATERTRIAGELHGLVLRGIEEMCARTRAARAYLGEAAGHVSSSIGEIEGIGRRALVEMRRLLLILGADGAPVPAFDDGAPTPARESDLMTNWIDDPRFTDVLIVVLMAVLAISEPLILIWVYRDVGDPSIYPWPVNLAVYIPVAAVLVAVFTLRRRAPLLVLAVTAGVIFSQSLFGHEWFVADRAIFVAVFTVAALRGTTWGWVALGVAVVAFAPQLRHPANLTWELGWVSQMAFAVLAGLAVRERQRINDELGERMETLRRTRQERVGRAVEEERSRIARDAHDMVAHGVTLMVIQAGAARWLAERDPEKARRALDSVERAGGDAVRELQSLVGSLGSTRDRVEPLPTRDQLTIQALTDQAVDDGMRVEVAIRGEPRDIDAGLAISVYRIVQEALTNIRKHAPGAQTRVELAYTPNGVDVDVSDTGANGDDRRTRSVPGAGRGLIGIAERVALFGGSLEAGPTPSGGFLVHATLHEKKLPT